MIELPADPIPPSLSKVSIARNGDDLRRLLADTNVQQVRWEGFGGNLGGKIIVPINKRLECRGGHYFDFSDGSELVLAGCFDANPHEHIFHNVSPSTTENRSSVHGHFGGLPIYMGWWLTPDGGEKDHARQFQAAINACSWDQSEYNGTPQEWRWHGGSTSVGYRNCELWIPYGGIALRKPIEMGNFTGVIKGPWGNGPAISFQGCTNGFTHRAFTPHTSYQNLHLHADANCAEDFAMWDIDRGGFFEPGLIEACTVTLNIPGDMIRVNKSNLNHLQIRRNQMTYHVASFKDGRERIPSFIWTHPNSFDAKFICEGNTFVGAHSGAIGFRHEARSRGVIFRGNHWESCAKVFYLAGHKGNVGSVIVNGDNHFEKQRAWTAIELPNPKWFGILDMQMSLYIDGNPNIVTRLHDAQHNGRDPGLGSRRIPPEGVRGTGKYAGIAAIKYIADASGYSLWGA